MLFPKELKKKRNRKKEQTERLKQIKKVHPDQFRWGLALEELKRKE